MRLLKQAYEAARAKVDGLVRRWPPGRLTPARPVWTPPDPEHLERARRMIEAGAEPCLALRDWLRAHEPPPAPAQDTQGFVQRLEARYGVVLPADLRRYLLEVAPQTDMDDANVMAWWGLERIRNLPEECASWNAGKGFVSSDPGIAAEQDKYIVFADYMIWCWAWAVCCSDGPNRGKVAVITGKDAFVADSVSDFIRDYIADPDEMAHRGI